MQLWELQVHNPSNSKLSSFLGPGASCSRRKTGTQRRSEMRMYAIPVNIGRVVQGSRTEAQEGGGAGYEGHKLNKAHGHLAGKSW